MDSAPRIPSEFKIRGAIRLCPQADSKRKRLSGACIAASSRRHPSFRYRGDINNGRNQRGNARRKRLRGLLRRRPQERGLGHQVLDEDGSRRREEFREAFMETHPNLASEDATSLMEIPYRAHLCQKAQDRYRFTTRNLKRASFCTFPRFHRSHRSPDTRNLPLRTLISERAHARINTA